MAAETVRERGFGQKKATDFSRTGYNKNSGPMSDVNVGKLEVRSTYRVVKNNLRAIERIGELFQNARDGNRLIHNKNDRSIFADHEHEPVVNIR